MTTQEIFNKLATHMAEGTAFHNESAQAFNFIGLWGFAKCHISHYLEEDSNLLRLKDYYATHYFKLIQIDKIPYPELIPANWYKYTTQEVDINTKRNTIKDLMTKWVEWEKQTKLFYQEMRAEFVTIGELDAAMFLDQFICDVSKELSHAQKKLIKLETLGYDMIIIDEMQETMYNKYKKKLGW